MDTKIVSAIIALIGVVLSVIISYLSTKKSLENETKKRELEFEQDFSNRILEKRLEKYPEINFELSHFIKELYGRKMTIEKFKNFKERIDKLNSENSILFSNRTTKIFFDFRIKTLYPIFEQVEKLKKDEELNDLLSGDARRNLRLAIGDLEVRLKDEIGINLIEYREIKKRSIIRDLNDAKRKNKIEK